MKTFYYNGTSDATCSNKTPLRLSYTSSNACSFTLIPTPNRLMVVKSKSTTTTTEYTGTRYASNDCSGSITNVTKYSTACINAIWIAWIQEQYGRYSSHISSCTSNDDGGRGHGYRNHNGI
jgi:hypothetical protein